MRDQSLLLGYFLRFLNQKTGTEEIGHQPIYDLTQEQSYKQACIDYIAGMTDNFAERCFKEIISFV